ncbi:hypothetical protein [Methylobacterium persicinum]|nr:hypothetical protein [Methylobacterium persicinum]GJE37842.1 hypothetical protein KHHGKMAE_1904 [Methylobacterium persicinum]
MDYPRMLYNDDGRVAIVQSAHEHAHSYAGWSSSPGDVHRAHPDGGRMVTQANAGDPLMAQKRVDPPGPIDAGTMRAMLREELSTHPGFDGAILAPILQAIVRAELAPLMTALGVNEAPFGEANASEAVQSDDTEAGDPADEPRKRRGRPPGSVNRLTETQE